MHFNFHTGLSTELYAASWFANKDYSIYWPMATQSRCDFLIEKEGIFQKVQVKKATWAQVGPYKYLQCRLGPKRPGAPPYREGDYDLMVFICDDKRIWIAQYEELKNLVSVCLDGTKENYKTRSSLYDPVKWRVK